MNTDARLTAKLLSACPPDSAQKEKLEDVLSKKYGKAVELVWQEDRTAQGGFRIELGSEVIDWTAEGRLEQLKERLTGLKSEGSVIPLIRDAVKSWVPEVCARGGQRTDRGGRDRLCGGPGGRYLRRDPAV